MGSMDSSKERSDSDRDAAEASDEGRQSGAKTENECEDDGLFKAWELPPVPDWARRPPARDSGTLFDQEPAPKQKR